MTHGSRTARFEEQVLVHLDSAYNLARWITRDPAIAQDAVQDGCLRAFKAFDQVHGPNARSWFLAVIRNACFDLLRQQRGRGVEEAYDEEMHGGELQEGASSLTPEDILARTSDARWLHETISTLPCVYREVLVLRELEELSYKEISAIVNVPIGTVMSRLSRGRNLLQRRMLTSCVPDRIRR